jgi:hypothetical protein
MTGVFQIQAKDSVFRLGASLTAVSMMQNFNWDVNSNEERMEQLGDQNFTAITQTPEISASFEMYSIGSLSQMLANMIYGINSTTGEFEAPSGLAANTKLWRETDLERAVFDLINVKKANEVFTRSEVLTRLHLESINIKADANGKAMDSFTAGGDLVEIFRSPIHDVYVVPLTRKAGALTTTLVMPAPFATETEAAIVDAGADYKLYAIDVDGDRILPSEVTIATASADIVLTGGAIAAGKSFGLGQKIAMIVHRKTAAAFPTLTYGTTARFVKAEKIDIFLVDPAATYLLGGQTVTTEAHLAAGRDFNLIPYTLSDRVLRVQSVDMTVNLNREILRQIAKNDRGNSIYYRAATFPFDIQASVSLLERDMSEWQRMTGKLSTDVLDLASFENKPWMLIMRYYLPNNTPVQTVGLLDARVLNPGMSIAVNGRVENSYTFSGSKFAVQGAAV